MCLCVCTHVFPGDFFSQKMSSLVRPCSAAPGTCNKNRNSELLFDFFFSPTHFVFLDRWKNLCVMLLAHICRELGAPPSGDHYVLGCQDRL